MQWLVRGRQHIEDSDVSKHVDILELQDSPAALIAATRG